MLCPAGGTLAAATGSVAAIAASEASVAEGNLYCAPMVVPPGSANGMGPPAPQGIGSALDTSVTPRAALYSSTNSRRPPSQMQNACAMR